VGDEGTRSGHSEGGGYGFSAYWRLWYSETDLNLCFAFLCGDEKELII
jgi:hypothetical protein